MPFLRASIGLGLMPVSFQAAAEAVMLVQGYLADGRAWHQSGVVSALLEAGCC